jgi:hypothetical protein
MCQLLGMNCNTPTDICFSFEGFRTRGGDTDPERAFCHILLELRRRFPGGMPVHSEGTGR